MICLDRQIFLWPLWLCLILSTWPHRISPTSLVNGDIYFSFTDKGRASVFAIFISRRTSCPISRTWLVKGEMFRSSVCYISVRTCSHSTQSVSVISKMLFCSGLNKTEACKNHFKSKLVRYGMKMQSIGDELFRTEGRTTW